MFHVTSEPGGEAPERVSAPFEKLLVVLFMIVALVKHFVGEEPSDNFAIRELSAVCLSSTISSVETEIQPVSVKPLSRYQQPRSQERTP